MYEKVSPEHPDKLCDRIAGALVDYAYTQEENPKIAVEVLLGHGKCLIISETSVVIPVAFVKDTVTRIAGKVDVEYLENKQDVFLADNQADGIRCGDNGIFTGAPITDEQRELTEIAYKLYERFHSDGKYIRVNDGVNDKLIICQSKAMIGELRNDYLDATINPLGYWTGGTDVDCGATNRKLGSDMGDGVTGGGLHGKDLSKADLSVNIFAHIMAQQLGKPVKLSCAIGDKEVDGVPYSDIVQFAREYIAAIGGFEKFAEWGLIRPEREDIKIEINE